MPIAQLGSASVPRWYGTQQDDDEERPVVEYMGARGDPDVLRHDVGQQQDQPRAADNNERLHHIPIIGWQVRRAKEQG